MIMKSSKGYLKMSCSIGNVIFGINGYIVFKINTYFQ